MLQPLTIYKSSAGSGKTYTLVQEYLEIVLTHPHLYKRVLAITFTNKATEEMKNRIIEALSILTYLPEKSIPQNYTSLYEHLSKHLAQASPTGKLRLQTQAEKVLTNILSDYSNFSVSTIESFFQRIIKAFSRELSLPIGYEIEMERNYVLDQITRASLLEVGRDKALTRLIQRYVSQDMESGKGWKVEGKIKGLGEKIFTEKFQELSIYGSQQAEESQVEKILAVVQELWAIRKQFEQEINSIQVSARHLLAEFHLAPADFKYKNTSVVATLTKQLDFNYPDKLIPGKRMRKAVEEPSSLYAKNSARIEDIEAAIDAGLHELIQARVRLHEHKYTRYLSAAEVLKHLYKFGVLSTLQEQLKSYREQNRMLMISDTNLLLRSITQEEGSHVSANTPFIYEKVGTQYQHYLIDEFQDTSDMQWANLFPLLAESLSNGHKSLIVGDAKQAIYRWRNGNMKLLMEEVTTQIQSILGQQPLQKNLSHNWRTRQEVVDFNNRFFERSSEYLAESLGENAFHSLLPQAYVDVSQQPTKTSVPGLVQYQQITVEKGEEWKEEAMAACLSQIQALEKEGYLKKDITLLVRRNREGLHLAQYLEANGISVYSAESLMIQSDPKVRLLIAGLQYLSQPDEDLYQAELSYFYALGKGEKIEFSTIGKKVSTPQKILTKHAHLLNEKTTYGCLMLLCDLFEVSIQSAYVLGLLEEAWAYVHQQEGSVSGFLAWWENKKKSARITASAHEEAVQIMTIHKAKGLEFPVVILPFAEWALGPNKLDILWIQNVEEPPYNQLPFFPVSAIQRLEHSIFKDRFQEEFIQSYLDNLNLLYVAFTRPKDRLYLMSPTTKSRSATPTSVSSLLQAVIPHPDLQMEASDGIWTYGQPPPSVEKKEKEESMSFLPLHLHRPFKWGESTQIKYRANAYLATDIRSSRSKISEGELFHEALSYIKTQKDIPYAVRKIRLGGKLEADYEENFEKVLKEICSRKEVVHWFDSGWEVKNEADLIDPKGQLLRPDRVMLRGETAIIIDYKTGKHTAAYLTQLTKYKEAISAMGYTQVEAWLYYILTGDLMSLEKLP
ncbi:MAG: UvrD-helicase domain-containing protein [Bacteroidota bacterium]